MAVKIHRSPYERPYTYWLTVDGGLPELEREIPADRDGPARKAQIDFYGTPLPSLLKIAKRLAKDYGLCIIKSWTKPGSESNHE